MLKVWDANIGRAGKAYFWEMEQLKKKGSIRVYHSFEEANGADDKEAASLTSAQCLAVAMQLIKSIYGYKGGRSPHRKITYIGYGFRAD